MTSSLQALARDGTPGDQFGFAKAISADTIMVGAPFESHDTNNDGSDEFTVGAAHLFERNQGGPNAWGEVSKLVASDNAADDQFGLSVAVSGKVSAVGALLEDNSNGTDAGAVYIFER